ncbi:hypothetical protein QBC35DRAFT_470455 [Podospora australis]|uniref:HTH CENPB-type domain-containing protein n=1 Tax=Podospora australis TaxID=1536484 RepID=A0AAN6X0L1_9PEZI|nr:hypothetical protein QBC35DRAFT_470455 [Podospora australis]
MSVRLTKKRGKRQKLYDQDEDLLETWVGNERAQGNNPSVGEITDMANTYGSARVGPGVDPFTPVDNKWTISFLKRRNPPLIALPEPKSSGTSSSSSCLATSDMEPQSKADLSQGRVYSAEEIEQFLWKSVHKTWKDKNDALGVLSEIAG